MPNRSWRNAVPVAVSLILASTLGIAPQASARTVAVTARPSTTSATPGLPVTVQGRATASTRVTLQRKVAGTWKQVTSTTTRSNGSYTLTVPTNWYLAHRLRVRDTKTTRVSTEFTVNVHPAYTPAGSSASWARLYRNNARWNPCKPITWRVNTAGGIPRQVADLTSAFHEVSLATGFTFRYLGPSTKQVGQSRAASYANILIDWQTPTQNKALAADTVGMAYNRYMRLKNRNYEFVGADIVLDSTEIALAEDYDGLPDDWNDVFFTPVATHEIIHAMGLAHVNDPNQIMHPNATTSRLGAGDLAGLRTLGAKNGCLSGAIR
jgi:predicted Zn-dependent protease